MKGSGSLKFAEVAVDSPGSGDRTFTYQIPSGFDWELGHSVLVPFGNQSRQGIVFAFSDTTDLDSVRQVSEIMAKEPLIDPIHLKLANWISNQYLCTLFQAASLMFPPGGRKRRSITLSVSDSVEVSELKLSEFQSSVVSYIYSREPVQLDRVISNFGENSRRLVSQLVEKQILIRSVTESSVKIRVKYEKFVDITKSGRNALLDSQLIKAPKQLHILENLSTVQENFHRFSAV